jgi:hypothetical protein
MLDFLETYGILAMPNIISEGEAQVVKYMEVLQPLQSCPCDVVCTIIL